MWINKVRSQGDLIQKGKYLRGRKKEDIKWAEEKHFLKHVFPELKENTTSRMSLLYAKKKKKEKNEKLIQMDANPSRISTPK